MAYEFMFSDYRGSDAWHFNQLEERAARRRGVLFTPEQLAAVLAIWQDTKPQGAAHWHAVDRLVIPSKTGSTIIQPHRVSFTAEPSAEQLRASMKHIAENWGGKASIPLDPNMSKEFRMRARAYAEVYGIELRDTNESFLDLRLTQRDLARVAAMRTEIRKAHADAPAARPNEEKTLAAMYHARNPYRVPTPA